MAGSNCCFVKMSLGLRDRVDMEIEVLEIAKPEEVDPDKRIPRNPCDDPARTAGAIESGPSEVAESAAHTTIALESQSSSLA